MTQLSDLHVDDQALVLAAVQSGQTLEQAILDVLEEHYRYTIREAIRQEMAAHDLDMIASRLRGGL